MEIILGLTCSTKVAGKRLFNVRAPGNPILLAAIFCLLIGDRGGQLRAQDASGVVEPNLLDFFALPSELSFQVRFETPFQTIPTVATTPPALIQATTNGFSAQIYGAVEHPMNAGLRDAAGVQWVNGQSFALIQERPAFAFGAGNVLLNPDNGDGINFARNSAADGMGKWNVETVVPPGNLDRWLSGITLLPLQNAPLIVFSQSDPDPASINYGRIESIKFAIASDDEGHGPWRLAPSGLDSVKYGLLSNFELASNRVIVAFLDERMTSLYLASVPAELDGSAWEIAPILTSPAPLSAVSVAVIGGKIMLSYAAKRSDGDADLYLGEPADGLEQAWETTRLGSIPSFGLSTALSEYGGQIMASYSYVSCDDVWEGPPSPGAFTRIPARTAGVASCSDESGVFVSPAGGTKRTWRQFTSYSDLLFGRWSTVQGRPVKAINVIQLGLLVLPEVHWRATPGPQLSITRGIPRYSRDLGGAYDSKVVNADRGGEFPEKTSFAATDLNGDKIPDLMVLGWVTNSAAVSALLGDGSGSFEIAGGYPILLSAVAHLAVPVGIQAGDLNGDGKMDGVVALGGVPGGTLFRVLLGDGTGALREPLDSSGAPLSYLAKGLQSYSPAFVVKALETGGRDEIIMRTASGAYSYVQALQLDASEQLVSAPGFPIQLPYQPEGGIFAADLNNDGRMDLATTSSGGSPDWPLATLLIRNSDGSFTTKTVGGSEYIVNAFMADLNNDGNSDFLLDVGGRRALLGDGLGDFEEVDSNLGGGPPAAALLDVNGDGILDILGHSFVSFVQFGDGMGRFGIDHEVDYLPVFAADLNGDRRSDLVGFDEDSRVRVWLHPSPGTSTLDLSLIGVPGKTYELFSKQRLDDPEWISLGQVIPDDYGRVSTFHQTDASTGFYRVTEEVEYREPHLIGPISILDGGK